MSTLIDERNAPRNEAELTQFSTAILYRLGMRLNIFAGVEPAKKEEAERAFCSLTSAEKAPIILKHLLAYDQNPQAAQAHMMVAPGAQPAGAQSPMTQGNFTGAPPGAGAPPGYQPQLPYSGPPAQQGGYGAPPGPPQGPPGGWQAPPGAGAPPGYGAPPGPPGYGAPPGPPQGAPPGPPQGGWQPPGPPGGGPGGPGGGFASPPNMGVPPGTTQGGWQPPGPPQGAPPGPPQGGWQPPGPPGGMAPPGPPTGAPPGYPPQAAPPRAPQTPSDPGNQGSVSGQLLSAIQGLAGELQRQNDILAGLSTLVETNFIASVIMAGRMNISNDELAHRLASERETVKAQILKAGK